MTPKEKAKELFDRFYGIEPVQPIYIGMDKGQSKQCALICVDEILEFAYYIEWEKKEEAISKLKFLKEVKEEINKL